MPKFQIITSPAGEEMVVIPKADYDAMIAALADADEDADDVAIYDARKADLTEEGTLPAEISIAILRGESRVHALRKYRGFNQASLAAAAGIAQGFLSDLENGRRNLTDPVAESLATALDVPADWLRA